MSVIGKIYALILGKVVNSDKPFDKIEGLKMNDPVGSFKKE